MKGVDCMKLKELPIASRIRDFENETVFFIAGHNPPGYQGSVLISDLLVNVGCYDAPEPENADDEIKQFGNNSYILSNVHQWLNASVSNWYKPTHSLDLPPSIDMVIEPYDNKPGFLSDFSIVFTKALKESEVNISTYGPYFLVEQHTISARVFLPSLTELGLEERDDIVEGRYLPLFGDPKMLESAPTIKLAKTAKLNRREFDPAISYPYWTRSVKFKRMSPFFSEVMCVGHFGKAHASKACLGSCGIRPVIVMDPETDFEDLADAFGAYILKKD